MLDVLAKEDDESTLEELAAEDVVATLAELEAEDVVAMLAELEAEDALDVAEEKMLDELEASQETMADGGLLKLVTACGSTFVQSTRP
jgi:hypothetical protein